MPFPSKTFVRAKPLHYGYRRSDVRRRHSFDGAETHNHLPPWPRTPCPSPHEILGVESGKMYDKENFLRLVKLYHPDLNGENSLTRSLQPAIRLERYRLIVAANELLSDPSKRKMYELYNVGWIFKQTTDEPGMPPSRPVWPTSTPDTSPANTRPDGRSGRYYTTMRQEPIYMSNGAFAVILLTIAMVGVIAQHERARTSRWQHKQLELALHGSILENLQDLILSSQDKAKDERVLEFLARRHLGLVRSDGHYHPLEINAEENMCRH
ncbi:Heat shock [Fusarium albosuccineum]|uniref:Heat shock n=1 Tax=Fusarium albosuccineum TaxID=1237068 RepID=A0A8H4L550_9HYPO|nr:Heat shock [Fusarium albosuccineum]